MKNAIKVFWIIVIFGFIFIACDNVGNGINNDVATYAIGDTGPGGGIVFYDKGTVSDGWRYLEVAPVNQGTDIRWASASFSAIEITGTGTAIGTGKENTALILAVDSEAPAALACINYRGGDKSDWFLPSLDELAELYKHRNRLNITEYWFWSSSQHPMVSSGAWGVDFRENESNSKSGGFKNYGINQYVPGISVRAIRAFASSSDGNSGVTTYTITYNGNTNTGGTVPVDSNSPYLKGSLVTVLSNEGNLVKINNTFTGWNTAANGSGTFYATGETFIIDTNITLFAQWTSTSSDSCTVECLLIGGTGPGGGIIFYHNHAGFAITGTSGFLAHYLEIARNNMTIDLSWASPNFTTTDITGTSMALGTGKENTALILATDIDAPAAKACVDYGKGTDFDDWFLPSVDELKEFYKLLEQPGISQDDIPISGSFWSSSQYSYNMAQLLSFNTITPGQVMLSSKASGNLTNGFHVRAVRAF